MKTRVIVICNDEFPVFKYNWLWVFQCCVGKESDLVMQTQSSANGEGDARFVWWLL